MSRRRHAAAWVAAVAVVSVGCGGGSDRAPAGEERPVAEARANGKSVFDLRCAPCHGTEGAGDGPAAAAITPKPRNFHDPEFWRGRTVDQLRLVVQQGKPGTLMPPFEGVLSAAEIDDVIAYVQRFRSDGR
ncbi:MAG TPA: cytochrome c [Candidatus Binatia bacterium]|nr:cytochrome c [Candidatus Binatia bacterium]